MLKFPTNTTPVNSDQKIHSFGIFDTLLTRMVGTPKAVFLLLGNYLASNNIIDFSPEVFARLRIQAQNAAFNKPDRSEVTLSQIYRELQDMIDISPEKAAEIMNLEFELEATLLTSIPGANKKVNEVLNLGYKVIFISDMYLPTKFIKEQLNKNKFIAENNCYVSNEYLKTKSTGELFKIAAQDCGIPAKNFTHHGDNKKADFDAPTKLKWNAVHYKDSKINRFEDILNNFMWETGGLSSAMAGASRLARLSIKSDSPEHNEIIKIAASVVAPSLVSFILWVLRRAEKKGLKRLYFVSRDGQIFFKVAEILIKELNLDIEPKYLYASRKAWHFASLTEIDSYLSMIKIKLFGEVLTVEKALSRISTEPEEIKTHLAEAGFDESHWKKDLTQKEIDKLSQVILKPEVQRLILQKAAEKRELVYEYLKQEGLTLDDKWALVDIGWGGTSQVFLGKIFELNNISPPKGFYFANKAKFIEKSDGYKEGYMLDRIRDTGYKKTVVSDISLLLESFCTADHNSVIGYKKEGRIIVPVLDIHPKEQLDQSHRKTIHEILPLFLNSLILDNTYLNPYGNLKPMVAKLIETFGKNPTKSEAKAWGKFLYEENSLETRVLPLAQPYQVKHLWRVFKRGGSNRKNVLWHFGALAISSKPMQKFVLYTAKAGRFARRIQSKYRIYKQN